MKYIIHKLVIIFCFTSCVTTTHIHYSDPNYLSSDEFSSYEELTKNNHVEIEKTQNDTLDISSENYNTDDYYDYSFSSRIKRFHRPMFYSNYYGGIYTDYYWYNTDPFYWGTSIYSGYNWCSPYYSYYSYSPYYYSPYYYSPYYYGNYYSFWYGNHHYFLNNNTYSVQNNNYDSYIDGPRRSLTTYQGKIRDTKNTNTLLSKTNKENSTIKIRTNKRDNTKDRQVVKFQDYSNFKTNKNNYSNTERNSNKRNQTYKGNRKNNTNYNSNRKNQKSNYRNQSYENRSNRNVNKRSVKPRK